MTTDAESMLDIVRRIATHLKEADEPGRRHARAPKIQDQAGSDGRRPPGLAARTGKRSERGFTIVEMLIAAVLVASAAGLIGTAIYQFFVVTSDGNERLIVLQDLQNVSLWVGRDTNEAQSFTAGTGTVYGTLTAGDPTDEYRYSYDAGNTALVREHLASGVPQSTLQVARRIANQGDVAFSVSGSLLTVSITATSASGSITESTTLKLSMRVR